MVRADWASGTRIKVGTDATSTLVADARPLARRAPLIPEFASPVDGQACLVVDGRFGAGVCCDPTFFPFDGLGQGRASARASARGARREDDGGDASDAQRED
jgi:hypothetical protein